MVSDNTFEKRIYTLVLLTLLYKVILEVSFWKVLTVDYPFYVFDFDLIKYLNGLFWVSLILTQIRYDNAVPSTFFLYFLIVLQIIPITIIYAQTAGMSPVYYNFLCTGFLICELLLGKAKIKVSYLRIKRLTHYILPTFFIISVIIIIKIIYSNGMPSMMALNIYDVYELRRSGTFKIGKYTGYLLNSVATVCLPILMIKAINSKKKLLFLFMAFSMIVIYLYTGQKTYLFSIGLCILGSFFATKDNAFTCFFKYFLLAVCGISVLAMIWPGENNIAIHIYSLFVRRVLFVPAKLKFLHYDYFSNHPHLWLYGALPVAINPYIPTYYITHKYPFEIGEIYFDAPLMSADTGFLAEGYARFGYIGILLGFLFLAIILTQIDNFRERTSYATAISFFIYPIYALSEQQILGTIVLGSWMFIFIILNHYEEVNVYENS